MKTYLIKQTYRAEVTVVREVKAETEEEAIELESEGVWIHSRCFCSLKEKGIVKEFPIDGTEIQYQEGPISQEITEKGRKRSQKKESP